MRGFLAVTWLRRRADLLRGELAVFVRIVLSDYLGSPRFRPRNHTVVIGIPLFEHFLAIVVIASQQQPGHLPEEPQASR